MKSMNSSLAEISNDTPFRSAGEPRKAVRAASADSPAAHAALAATALAMPAEITADGGERRGQSQRAPRANGASRSLGENPFGPDVILPEQFFDRSNGMEQISGERALMLAVLEDGIRCFQEHLKNPRVRPRLLARQAEKWIRSSDWDWPFSFNNVCDSLSLNPDCLRAKLLAPRENGEAAPKPRPSSHRVYRLTPRVKPPRRR